ncbi:Vacuolar membrane protein [Escovopsis weberi]|uniref:Vacuolar membrane protein n=1 Tax=Escovopsis weberi TaxID=150374 RepID=A0A0M8N210_ESCWE|nr:Vacuolar membrane protein [Escovopsis weberi]
MSATASFSSFLVATATNLSSSAPSSSPSISISASASASTAALALALAPSSSSSSASAFGPLRVDQSQGECELLGPFALVVQAALGALALLSLVFKRWRERPQRPVKVWFFDASKQVFGSVLVHMSNIFMSMLTSGRFSINAVIQERGEDPYVPNPCSFYLLNLAIDPLDSIQSGYYGHPPRSWWWLKQSFIYFSSLFGMKICVLIIFIMMPWISRVGDWALRWTEGDEKLQVAFVMMIFPLIMNAIQYYIIDSFIKKPVHVHGHHHHHHHRRRHRGLHVDDDDDGDDPDADSAQGIRIFDGARFSALDGDEVDDDDDNDASSDIPSDSDSDLVGGTRRDSEAQKRRPRAHRKLRHHRLDNGYDPDADSRSTASAAASSSSSQRPPRHDIAELLPKE